MPYHTTSIYYCIHHVIWSDMLELRFRITMGPAWMRDERTYGNEVHICIEEQLSWQSNTDRYRSFKGITLHTCIITWCYKVLCERCGDVVQLILGVILPFLHTSVQFSAVVVCYNTNVFRLVHRSTPPKVYRVELLILLNLLNWIFHISKL